MINLTINGKKISAPKGATIMEAAKANNINIPNLCYLQDVHKFGSCRICVVEVKGARTLQASCMTAVSEGMEVYTNSDKVRKARKVLYELILSDHSQECLSCKRNKSCELQELGKTLGVDETRFHGERSDCVIDLSPSIIRDTSKCILCRRCVTACNIIQGTGVINAQNRGFKTVIGTAMDLPLGDVNCIFCGQCTVVCPVDALKEADAIEDVWDAINNEKKYVVAQTAPAIRVALGEEFGYEPGTLVTGKLAASLRALGFDSVFDTNFTADLTIMEEGTELLNRLKNLVTGKEATLPMITSCSPGWIKYVEHTYPEKLDHLSTCKSPHTMMGALIKSYYAKLIDTDPGNIYVVSIMPCTAKKFEISRPEMKNDDMPNVDAVLTTRELASMIKGAGIDFVKLPDEEFDNPLGMSTGAADIFGVTGGVMEAALRTVYELVTGREIPFKGLHVTPVIGFDRVKTAEIIIENPLPEYAAFDQVTLKVAVTSGTKGAKQLMDEISTGKSKYHFIEVMGCPGGCITGGGQPRSQDPKIGEKRLKGLYKEDEGKPLRKSHENPYISAIYKEFLEYPGSHISHELLHTHYVRRGIFNELTDERFAVNGGIKLVKHKLNEGSEQSSRMSDRRKRIREESESEELLVLRAENEKLKNELADTLETVEIFKQVIADQSSNKNKHD
ncbi:MAG: NADH-dependent [FeFe] hydrogenase, group A6 [Oscillospiraceae bacterium]|nr:NADH-dependent [FeFe] hydrogenase, group A6 [Oscillospiraceae bacterium]